MFLISLTGRLSGELRPCLKLHFIFSLMKRNEAKKNQDKIDLSVFYGSELVRLTEFYRARIRFSINQFRSITKLILFLYATIFFIFPSKQ